MHYTNNLLKVVETVNCLISLEQYVSLCDLIKSAIITLFLVNLLKYKSINSYGIGYAVSRKTGNIIIYIAYKYYIPEITIRDPLKFLYYFEH